MAGVTTHLSTRGCETLEMVFRVFVDGVNAGAGIPLFLFFFLVRGVICVESNMYGRSSVFPYYVLMSSAK